MNRRRVLVASLLFCAAACAGADDARRPKLDEADVAQAARRHLDALGVDMTGVRAERPEFDPDLRKWLVVYRRDSLVIGRGNFGVFVSDDDIADIRIRPSR